MISLEYFLGAFITLSLFLFLMKELAKKQISSSESKFINRQSLYVELNKLLTPKSIKRVVETQSIKHAKLTNIKVLIMEDQAFWIKNNAVYTAPVENDEVQKNSATRLDMMAMNKVELDKIMFVIDKLNEGKNDDHRDSGI
jgi:hypothetical protein